MLLACKIIIPKVSFRCILRKYCTREHLKLYNHCSQAVNTDPQQVIPGLLLTEPNIV